MLTAISLSTLVGVVGAAVALQVAAPSSGVVAVISGFFLVCAGTLLVTRISHSYGALGALHGALRDLRGARGSRTSEESQWQWFLRAASFFRYGNIRPAEEAARNISAPILRRGTQLVLDGLPRTQLVIALQRQIVEERENLAMPVELLRAMAGYAPTLGMLGTLLGLLQMLFGASSGDIASMSAAMGFAMITTVYGLVIANLLLKPLATKVEHRNRRRLTQALADVQAVMLLFERQHPEYIREVMNDRRADEHPRPRLAALSGSRV